MDSFREVSHNNRQKILQNSKNYKQNLDRQQQREKKIAILQSHIRRFLSNTKTFKQINEQASDIAIIMQKKQEQPVDKFCKTMSIALKKMPFFLQYLLQVRKDNLSNHYLYLLMLIQCLIVKKEGYPVLNSMINGRQFNAKQATKIMRLALIAMETYRQDRLQAYIVAYAKESDKLDGIVSQPYYSKLLLRLILNKTLSQDSASYLTGSIVRKYVKFFQFSHQQAIQLLFLNPKIVCQDYFKKVKNIQNCRNVFIGCSLQQIQTIYNKTLRMLQEAARKSVDSNGKPNVETDIDLLIFHATLHCMALQAYAMQARAVALERFYKRRDIIITNENYEDVEYVVNKSVIFNRFLQSLDTKFYSEWLFKSILQVSRDDLLQVLMKLCSLVLNLLKNSFSQQLTVPGGQMIMLGISKFNRKKQPAENQFLFLLLHRTFSMMDDFQFSKEYFSKQAILQIIKTVGRYVRELLGQEATLSEYTAQHRVFVLAAKVLSIIYEKNFRTKLYDPSLFVMDSLDERLRNNTGVNYPVLIEKLKNVPFIIDLDSRYTVFRKLVRHNFPSGHGGNIVIRRNYVYDDAMKQLHSRSLKQRYEFSFIDKYGEKQRAYDAGGPTKQFVSSVCKEVFHPKMGLFVSTPTKQLMPNPVVVRPIKEYRIAGSLLGLALASNISIQPQFSGIFLNLLLGKKNTLDDVQFVDRQVYENLIKLKHGKYGNVQALCLNFSILNNGKEIELREGGRDIAVTDDNKIDFIMDYSDFLTNRQIAEQSNEFRQGLLEIVQVHLLRLFNHDEFNRVISGGKRDIDIKDLRSYAILDGYTQKDDTIVALWQVLSEFTPQQKQNFLLFITACSRPPLQGFRDLQPPIKIKQAEDATKLPIAHTCANILRLPDYKDPNLLRAKLLIAIENHSGFGFA